MSELVELDEYSSCVVQLTHKDLIDVRAASGTALTFEPADQPGSWTIRARGQAGTIVTPAVRILIRPKVDAANLFHMLEAGGRAIDVESAAFDYEVSGDLLSAFATFFVRILEQALARGVPRVYVEHDERLAAVRGRIDLARQLRAGGLPLPMACRYDEYTPDSQLNRIVVAAVARLGRLPGVAPTSRHALRAARSHFDGVGSLVRADLDAPTRFTRLDRHFEPVERLSRLVLAGSALIDRAGSNAAGSFLVDMSKLFEKFVETRMVRYLRGRLSVDPQVGTTLDRDGAVRMRPDLAFRSGGQSVYVGDCKYKLTADGVGRESDYYQLLAYCTALRLNEGMLIYCQHDGSVPMREVTVRDPLGTRLVTYAVELAGTPAMVETRMSALADEIHRRALERSNLVNDGVRRVTDDAARNDARQSA